MTDKRWKAVERGTAEALNHFLLFSDVGKQFTPIERIPLLGREGPDLTVNETGLVINVKSRKSIPPYLFPPAKTLVFSGKLVIFRLHELTNIWSRNTGCTQVRQWKQLNDWYERMDQWTKEFQPDGISAIFLHRPRMSYDTMGIAIHSDNLRRLSCNLKITN